MIKHSIITLIEIAPKFHDFSVEHQYLKAVIRHWNHNYPVTTNRTEYALKNMYGHLLIDILNTKIKITDTVGVK